ncbi:hypothetical protein RHGRI_027436 [Rhododendron griersonianum]|uniref:Uncharacterized protein n=1 Tax=Rhododendron griersonianum TaxID=479676 RepID=A0AAV6IYE6_9ERIC|nr:hypothetical protein RHGRI_027436 [Rhododendron griersonianum]
MPRNPFKFQTGQHHRRISVLSINEWLVNQILDDDDNDGESEDAVSVDLDKILQQHVRTILNQRLLQTILAVVLNSGHIVVQISPAAVPYLALIPAGTIPRAWILITAGYLEQSAYGVVISAIGLLFLGKLVEVLKFPTF